MKVSLGWGAFAALSLSTVPSVASACGGFFCSQVPVDQSGEQILFAVEGTTVTAHIQISYQGEADKFSWVLPLPTLPEIGVGTDELFTRLRAYTDPTFNVVWQPVDGCNGYDQCMMADASAGGGDGGDDGSNEETPGVQVLAEGDVGPFEYKVVEADTGDVLFEWLNDNGYDQPEASKPLVGHYVNKDFVFLALKLQKDKAAGDIQPVVVTYQSDEFACVPLKLTSIAAAENMPVTTWVLAGSRAVPMNFFHVVLNAKAYPWLECGGGYYWFGGANDKCKSAYSDLVTEAANAANGHAFVTEYAGASTIMKDQLFVAGQYDTSGLATIDDPMLFMSKMLELGFPRNSQTQAVIRKWIPKPADLPDDCDEDQEFYTWNLENCLQHMPSDYNFDPAGFAADLNEKFTKPLEAAQRMFDDKPYLTRLFTTISPDEMDKDPIFSFNPDLPNVPREHSVKATPVCEAGQNTASKVTIEYGDGTTETVGVKFQDCSPPILEGDGADGSDVPYAEIQILGESGEPTTVEEGEVPAKEAEIDQRVTTVGQSELPQNPAVVGTVDGRGGTFGTRPDEVTDPKTTGSGSGGSSGCSSTNVGTTAAAGLFGLALLALAARRRRS